MEIQATLKFKHGRLVRFLKEHRMTVKRLAELSGVRAVNLGNFIRFKSFPRFNREEFVRHLQSIDPDITFEEIFPDQYKEAIRVLKPRVSTADIPIDKLLPYDDALQLEYFDDPSDRLTNEELAKIAINTLKESHDPLFNKDRAIKIISLYYGIGCESKTLGEIGKEFRVSASDIRCIKDRALKKMFRNPKLRKAVSSKTLPRL
jgi:transcriptional regulator with XRE-family HTH domain